MDSNGWGVQFTMRTAHDSLRDPRQLDSLFSPLSAVTYVAWCFLAVVWRAGERPTLPRVLVWRAEIWCVSAWRHPGSVAAP